MTSPSVKECALCASSAHDVHHANVCALHVIVRVHVIPLCDDVVLGLTLGLIALVVIVFFVVAFP